MEGNPIDKLKSNVKDMTDLQRKVADYIIKNSVDVAFLTMDQLARNVNTSTTTIMRLVILLGYSGYSEFQKELQSLLKNKVNPRIRLEANLKEIDKSNLWLKCQEKHSQNIKETLDSITNETLDKVVSKLETSRNIYFISGRGGKSVALYLQNFLNRISGNCFQINADLVTDWVDSLQNINSSDLIFVISYPRYAIRLIEFIKLAKKNNVPIICMTDSYSSPIASYSDIVLPCSCSSLGFHNSPVTAMIIADFLISVVSIRNSDNIKIRLEQSNKILIDLNYYYE